MRLLKNEKKLHTIFFNVNYTYWKLKIPSILESTYPLDKEDMGQAFYNIKYLVQNLFFLVFVIFINIILLILLLKNKK